MAFRFRLETNLKLARQKLEIAQGELAEELRKLQEAYHDYDQQMLVCQKGLRGYQEACLKDPVNLKQWQIYCIDQREKLNNYLTIMEEQEKKVETFRENLKIKKIEFEKYKRLKEKQWKEYWAEELRKEQSVIDEIAQHTAEVAFEI